MNALRNVTDSGLTRRQRCKFTTIQKVRRSTDLSIGFIVALLNIIEIILILRLKRKKRAYEYLLLSLSCSDLLFGIANGFVSAIYLSESCKYKEIVNVIYSVYLMFILSSMLHLTWIALDRLWAIHQPFKRNQYVTKSALIKIIVFTWFLCFTIALTMFLLEEVGGVFDRTKPQSGNRVATRKSMGSRNSTSLSNSIKMRNRDKSPTKRRGRLRMNRYKDDIQLIIAIIITIADIILTFTYSLIIILLRYKTKKSRIHTKRDNRVSVVCILIAAVFVVFTLPYAVKKFLTGRVGFYYNLLLIINSALNSIVYFFRQHCERYLDKRYKHDSTDNDNYSNTTPLSTPSFKRSLIEHNNPTLEMKSHLNFQNGK